MGLRKVACLGWLSLLMVPASLGACGSGSSGPATMNNGAGGGSSGSPTATAGIASASGGDAPTGQCAAESLASARIWRLTDVQFVNVVKTVFGVQLPAEVTEADAKSSDYTNFSENNTVTAKTLTAYQTAARDAARQAVTSHFAKFMPCTTEVCAEQFVRNRVARAFGRRLDADEVSGYVGLFREGAKESPQAGLRMMIEAALQSPSFLYRTELGKPVEGGPSGTVTLTPHEIATSLSFTFMNSVPDETLWNKADNGSLADPAILSAEVERLLELPETKANLAQLAGYWLGIERIKNTNKDQALFGDFTPQVQHDLYTSGQLFVQDVLANGTVSDLLTSHKMFLNENLAKTYGIPGVTGSDMRAVDVTLPERGYGILTQPGVLAAYSRPNKGDPIHRGLFIYYALACGSQLPPPPGDAADVQSSFPANATEREYTQFRAANARCNACHRMFDPLGLASERYDTMGRYHETDTKGPIDQTSMLADLGGGLSGAIDGISGVVSKLVDGRRVSDCAASNLAVFALGREFKGNSSCALQTIKDKLAATGHFKDFYRALATSPAFVTRDVK